MTGYVLCIFKVINGTKELYDTRPYPYASGTEMMDVLYGARHFGIANYFNLPEGNTYDLDFMSV